jgi:hypothetical protein
MDRQRMRGGASGPLPRPATPGVSFSGFALCWVPHGSPAELLWRQELYRQALAEAQAVVRPSLPERDLLAAWN